MSSKKQSVTIRLSDTVDRYARRTHVNVRNKKVTLVHRWKDSGSAKAHTQRVTLTDEQAGRLAGLLAGAASVATYGSPERNATFQEAFTEGMLYAGTGSTDPL